MHEDDANETVLYLTFKVGRELLAFEVSHVREVLDLCSITRVPRTPEYMKGVINLRGTVIPVLDLRLRFGLTRTESGIEARIVVIEFEYGDTTAEVGILTESVHDVIGIDTGRISPPSDTGRSWRSEYIRGIGKYVDTFVLLLDIQKVLDTREDSLLLNG